MLVRLETDLDTNVKDRLMPGRVIGRLFRSSRYLACPARRASSGSPTLQHLVSGRLLADGSFPVQRGVGCCTEYTSNLTPDA